MAYADRKKYSGDGGQSLVEVMIALFVLTAGFLGILSLLAQSIHLSKTVSNNTIATYLAAEGIELARNLVDHDIYQRLSGWGGWQQGASDPTFLTSGNYQLDYTFCTNASYSQPCQATPLFTNQPLRFDPTTNMYSYGGSVVTPFTREIHVSVDPVGDPNHITVDSVVTWSTGTFTNESIDIQDHLYNWRPAS